MTKQEIKKELEKQLQLLSKLSESRNIKLEIAERISIANAINTLAVTIANL